MKKENQNEFENDAGLDLDIKQFKILKKLGLVFPNTKEDFDQIEKEMEENPVTLPLNLEKTPSFSEENYPTGSFVKGTTVKLESSSIPQNDYFKKMVLAAEITFQLFKEPTFGRIKLVKLLYLCQEVCSMKLSTVYEKHAAGPLDPKYIYTIDAEFKKQKWFTKVKRDSYGYKYLPLENAGKHQEYFTNYYSESCSRIDEVINLFRTEKSDHCEIVATMYYLWKEYLAKKNLVNNATLVAGFYSWNESKKRFDEKALTNAIEWMSENNIVPIK